MDDISPRVQYLDAVAAPLKLVAGMKHRFRASPEEAKSQMTLPMPLDGNAVRLRGPYSLACLFTRSQDLVQRLSLWNPSSDYLLECLLDRFRSLKYQIS